MGNYTAKRTQLASQLVKNCLTLNELHFVEEKRTLQTNPSVCYTSILSILHIRACKGSRKVKEEQKKRCEEEKKRTPSLIPQICDNKSLWVPRRLINSQLVIDISKVFFFLPSAPHSHLSHTRATTVSEMFPDTMWHAQQGGCFNLSKRN